MREKILQKIKNPHTRSMLAGCADFWLRVGLDPEFCEEFVSVDRVGINFANILNSITI